jgi:hypothetical protein
MPVEKGQIINPTGKGGFGDNPQNRTTNGNWSKLTSIQYWQNYFIRLTIDEFDSFKCELKAQQIAYERVKNSVDTLAECKELQDRTEGKAQIVSDITTNGKDLQFGFPSIKDFYDEKVEESNE